MSATDTIRPDWWKGFDDEYLDELIDKAINDNVDLHILAARTGVAEATIGQAKAAALPTLTTGGAVDYRNSTGQSATQQYSVGASSNWEIDVWGKFRKGAAAQKAEYRASEADWRAGYLALVSDVASTYFQIRQIDEQLDRQQQAVDKSLEILAIYESLYAEGLLPETQVLQQRAEVSRLRTELLELQRVRDIAENGLATLLGVPAGELEVPAAHLSDTVRAIDVPAGLPSELLSRRPDILAAEYRVLQAHHLEGQARLDKLPSVSLTARDGSSSFALSNLLKAWTFGLGPSINFPIFDPNINARIKVNEAQVQVAEEQYRKAVMVAYEEVENTLVNLASRKHQREQLTEQLENLRTVSAQIDAQLSEGLVSQLEVFEIERSLLTAEQALLANHQQILSETVRLYKALGGGWPSDIRSHAADQKYRFTQTK